MNYRKFLEDNNPFLISDIKPILKKIYTDKTIHTFAVIFSIFVLIWGISYTFIGNKKSVNKILLSRENTLNEEIVKINNDNNILEAEILLLKDKVKSLTKEKEDKKLAKIATLSTATKMKGKGIEIVLNDNTSKYAPEQASSNIIHNTDLLKIVNFLWEENAEGISINEERITPQTSINCIGATILINDKRIAAPFKIKAIGKNFTKSMVELAGVVLSLKLRGIELDINEKNEIILPAGNLLIEE